MKGNGKPGTGGEGKKPESRKHGENRNKEGEWD